MTLNTSPTSVRSVSSLEAAASMEEHPKKEVIRSANDDDVSHANGGSSESAAAAVAPPQVTLHETRSLILRLTVLVGNLCSLVLQTFPLDPAIVVTAGSSATTTTEDDNGATAVSANAEVRKSIAQILSCLLDVSSSASIHLETAILKKMELNRRKYPVDLCKGKAGKYTEYSHQTGITRDAGQSTLHLDASGTAKIDSPMKKKLLDETVDEVDGQNKDAVSEKADFAASLPELTASIREFAQERLWSIYHLPRNLILALLGELGELAELLQWKGDNDSNDDNASDDKNGGLSLSELDKLSQELADVTIYLIRFADVCQVDLQTEMEQLLSP